MPIHRLNDVVQVITTNTPGHHNVALLHSLLREGGGWQDNYPSGDFLDMDNQSIVV